MNNNDNLNNNQINRSKTEIDNLFKRNISKLNKNIRYKLNNCLISVEKRKKNKIV